MNDKILLSKQLKDPNFLGSHDLCIGIDKNEQPVYGELTVTIADVKHEAITDMEKIRTGKRNPDGTQTKMAYTLYFKQSNVKPYVIKAACVIAAVEKATGTKVVNKWIGKDITFYVEKGVYMPGTKKADNITTDALRVREYTPKPATKHYCECGCGAEITAANGMTAEEIAQYTAKKYGKKLTAKCAARVAQELNKTEEGK